MTRGMASVSKMAWLAGTVVLNSAAKSAKAVSGLSKVGIAYSKILKDVAKTGATPIAQMLKPVMRTSGGFAAATGKAVRQRLATPGIKEAEQKATEKKDTLRKLAGWAGLVKKMSRVEMAGLRENATRDKRQQKKDTLRKLTGWAAQVKEMMKLETSAAREDYVRSGARLKKMGRLELAALRENAIRKKISLALAAKDAAKDAAKGGPWRRFALEVRDLDREVKLLLFPFKFFGKIAALPFKAIYGAANLAGKTLNVFILRPLRAMLTISRVAGKGFKLLGGAISTAFSVGLGPIGILLKLFSPLLEMVAKFLEPAFESFAAAIEVALGPLDFVIETLMQQLAPIIADTIKPFVGLIIAFLADTAPGFIKWFAGMAAQAAPLAAELAAKLVPAMKDMVENIQKFFVLYGPDILAFGKKVWDFWSNASDYMKKFNILFIDPIVDGIKGIWKTVQPFVQPIFDAIAEFVAGLEIVKKAKAYFTGEAESVVGPGAGTTVVTDQRKATNNRIAELMVKGVPRAQAEEQARNEWLAAPAPGGAKRMAKGGILVGEAGPEAILPLRADAFAGVLGPLMLPGFASIVSELQAVRRVLQGTLVVQSKDDAGSGSRTKQGGARAQEDADLGESFGMVPAW